MPTYGGFETVSELHRSGLAAVWSARKSSGGEAVFAVKVVQPDTLIYGREAAAGAVTAFLEQADVQRRAATAGGAGGAWAPVHESGVHEDGAYLVTDLFNRSSVERLVSGRFRVDGPGLHRAASAVVQGLVELDRAARRAHGNLKPTNVLVAGEGNVAIARIALTDPASASKAKSVGTAGDLRAFGTILYQFVTHQQFRDAGGYPVPEGREWLALGPGGRKWLALTNRLLDPAPATPPTLEEVSAAVAEAGAAKSKRPSPLVLGAAAAVFVAGGVGAYFALRPPAVVETPDIAAWDEKADQDWHDFCTLYAEWGSKFIASLDQPVGPDLGGGERRALYQGDPELSAVVADIDNAKAAAAMDPMGIAGMTRGDIYSLRDNAPEKVRTVKGLDRFRGALGLLRRVETLAGGEWARAKGLHALAEQWNGQGWTRAGTALKELASSQKPGASVDVAEVFDHLFVASKAAAEVEAKQADVKTIAQSLITTDDAVLKRFDAWVGAAGGAEGSAGGVEAVKELSTRLADAAALGRRLTSFLDSGWRSVDRQYLAEQSPVYQNLSAVPSKELFERWLAEAANPRYAVPSAADDPTTNWRGESRLREVKAQLDQLRDLKESPKPETVAAVDELAKRVDALKALEWTRRNVDQKVRDAAVVQADLDRVWGELSRTITEVTVGRAESANAARTQLAARNEIVPNSVAINAAWGKWRDGLVKTITETNYTQVPAQAHELEQALVKFNEAMPAGLTVTDTRRPWHGRLAQVALAEREARASAAMTAAGAGVPDPAPLATTLAAVSSGYAEWLRGVESAALDAKALEDLLDGGYGLTEADATGATVRARFDALAAEAVFKEPRVAGELRPVTERVAELERIEKMTTPAEFASLLTAEPAARAEAAIAAWRRIGSIPGRSWPATPEELRQEATYRARVSIVSGLIPDRARSDALAAEMKRVAVERWTRTFAAVTAAADVEAVISQMPAHGVTPESVTEPRLVYNLLISDLKKAVLVPRASAPSDEQVLALARPFLEKAKALGAPVTGAAKAVPVLAELDPIVSQTEPPPPPFDPASVGPGIKGWRGEKVGGAIDLLRYTLGADGAGQVLEFRRVEPTDGVPEPVYLCTTEMPVGAMLEVLRTAHADADFLALTAPRVEGPAGWMRAGSSTAVAAEWSEAQRSRLSRYPGITPTPADVDPGKPGPDLPVQQVSPSGAVLLCRLMGCRLPTAAEWKAASAATPAGDLSQWNLRDATWKKQLDHVVKVREVDLAGVSNKELLDWPDFGAINRMKSPVEKAAAVQASSDGVLWFRPVSPAAGPAYVNLYGNVSELLFSDAAALEAVAPTGDAVKAAANAGADKFGVIGGSAMSAPTVPLDQPQPVDRFDVEDLVGFADVGFRPAFSATGTSTRETYAARLARVLTADPYLH